MCIVSPKVRTDDIIASPNLSTIFVGCFTLSAPFSCEYSQAFVASSTVKATSFIPSPCMSMWRPICVLALRGDVTTKKILP